MCTAFFSLMKVFMNTYMIINKLSKNYNLISLNEVKESLAIDAGDNAYDSQIRRYIKSSCNEAEHLIGQDIALTYNELIESSYICPFSFSCYEIGQGNITVSAITLTTIDAEGNESVSTLSGSTYFVEANQNFTRIRFKNWITGNVLKIYFTSGYATAIPEPLKQAISVRVATYLDAERSEYVQNGMIRNKAFNRLLSPYINL